MNRTEVTDLLSKAKAATPGRSYINISQSNGTEVCMFNNEYTIHLSSKNNGWKQTVVDAEFLINSTESITRLAESYLWALEVIMFYSEKSSWYGSGYNVDTIQHNDLDEILVGDCNYAFGGMRAREFLRKIGE